jgi:hypothetical protein
MPVSPADFYAYSQATGVQVPDSPEERAQLAPRVVEFRRNQLKQPQEGGFDPMSMGVGIGLALAGAGAGALALRGRNKIPKATKTTGQSGIEIKDLNREDLDRTVNVGKSKELTRQESDPAVKKVVQQDPGVIKRATQDLSRFVESVEAPAATVTSSIGQTVSGSDLQTQVKEQADAISQQALTDFAKREQAAVVDQQINAVGSGEDQMTGRVRQQLQRNEDINLMEVDALEDINQQVAPSSSDAPITQAASQTADGIPIDQAEGTISQGTPEVKNFLINERRKVWDAMQNDFELDPIKNMPPTHARVEQELARRLGPGAYKFGPTHSANRQAMEIYAMTGDPRVTAKEFGLSPVTFETFENMPEAKARAFESGSAMSTEGYPSENITPVIEKTGIKVNVPGMGEVDLADLRRPVITESTATSAEDFYQDQISKKKDWLTGVEADVAERYEKINNIKREEILASLDKVENILNQAVSQGNTKMANAMRARKQKLENQFENPDMYTPKNPDVYAEDNLLKARLRGARNKAQEMLADTSDIKKYPTTIDWSGGTPRVFGEQDPLTGEFIPETMELRSDRKMIDTDPKGGGGRNVAEFTAGEALYEQIRAIQSGGRYRDYDETGAAASRWQDPRTSSTIDEPGVGSTTDIYGVRPDLERQADPKKRPSEPQYTKEEITAEAMRLASSAPEGDVPVAPDYAAAIESLGSQPKTEASRRSVLMSEAVRKAARKRSERNPMTGKIPQELEVLRRTMPDVTATDYLGQGPRTRVAGLPPQQRTIPGVTGYGARQRQSPADVAAQQLESYMKQRMVGRSTPLTSQAVIQPKLF